MSHWWESSRSRRAASMRSTRRRLRASYRQQVRLEVAAIAEQLHRVYEGKARAERDRASSAIAEAETRLSKVSAEVVRLSLEYGPHQFGSRYTLYATMSQSLMERGYNLKEIAGYIIENLSARLRHEFAQIDFSRIKPARFEPDEQGRPGRYPVWKVGP